MAPKIYAFETDTVWGMGCHPLDKVSVEKIYEIKGRNRRKPLILMGYRLSDLLKYASFVPKEALDAMEAHFPGALTVILKSSLLCPRYISENTIAIRIPNHKGFWDLCKGIEGGVLATTSLNLSNELPCRNFEEAKQKFQGLCQIIKPKEAITIENKPSTIVDYSDNIARVIRQGSINL